MNHGPKIIRHKNGATIEVEKTEIHRPAKIDELRSIIKYLQKITNKFEVEFKNFDKSAISKDFLYLNWNYAQSVKKAIEDYELVDRSTYAGIKAGKPKNIEAMKIAKRYVEDYQAKVKDSSKYPTGIELQAEIERQISALVLSRIDAPKYVEVRTCSSWLTQMKRGTFKIKDEDDPWD
jgi:uncharacterized protein (UPF0262 family)